MSKIPSLLIRIILYCLLVLVFSSCQTIVHGPPPPLLMPLKKYRISQKFSPSSNLFHRGLDLSAPRDTPVLSSHLGSVVYAGQRFSGYGKIVIVEFSNDWSSLYAHLNTIAVKQGQKVSQGTVLGTVGHTGKATGDHLHFELRYKKHTINPIPYLKPY